MNGSDPNAQCPTCRGRRHVRVEGTSRWRRCDCIAQTVQNAYIHSALRGQDLVCPPGVEPTLPLRSAAFTGSYDTFRFRVWRSLEALRPTPYTLLTNTRVSVIHFEKDEQYSSLQALREEPPLIILTIGMGDVPHKWSGMLALHLVTLREMHGLPIWVYAKSVFDLTGYDVAGQHEGRELATWVVKHLVAGTPDWTPSRAPAALRALPEPPKGRSGPNDPLY